MESYKKWIGSGINSDLKSSINNNVLNIIRALVEDSQSTVYIPNSYQNSSRYRSSGDPSIHFLPSECGKQISVLGLQSNQERFNFSMIGLVDVLVEYPNKDGTIDLKNKKIFRQYNIIRDGKLTMDYISAKLSKDSFDALKKIGILYYNGLIVPENHNYNKDYVYKIVLKDLPLVSYAWAQPYRIGLIQYMNREEELCTILKTLRSLMKEYKSEGREISVSNEESEIYYEKYSGSQKVEKDIEEVDCIVYSIDTKYIYSIETAREEYDGDIDSLNESIKKYNKELRYVRYLIRCMVYSIENTKKNNSFIWSESEKSNRSNKIKQTYKVNLDDGSAYTLTRTTYKKKV